MGCQSFEVVIRGAVAGRVEIGVVGGAVVMFCESAFSRGVLTL